MINKRKRVLILLNMAAGTGKAGLNTWAVVKKYAESGFEPVVFPIIPGTDLVSEKLLEDYDGETDVVFCSGGDGTLNHVIQSVMHMADKPVIAYLPSGSTNDFAKTHKIPSELDKALDIAVNGQISSYDVGSLNDRFFNYVAAFGAFSAISYDTDQQLKNFLGHAAYFVNAVSGLDENIHYSRHMRIEADDVVLEDDYIFGAVCNSVSIAGFMVFRESDVAVDDGKMELLLVKTPKTGADLQGLLNAAQRGTMDHPLITFKHVSELRIISSEDTAWSIDGEYGGAYKEALIRVNRQAVSIMKAKL